MNKVELISETKYYVECPHCHNSKNRVDHLFNDGNEERTFGHWYCDECGNAYKGKVKGKEVSLEKVDRRLDKSIVFLKKKNVLLAVKGMYFDGDLNEEGSSYFYNEGTCPTNYLQNVEMVINLKNFDTDPHGIFKFVGQIPFVDLDKVEDTEQFLKDNNINYE